MTWHGPVCGPRAAQACRQATGWCFTRLHILSSSSLLHVSSLEAGYLVRAVQELVLRVWQCVSNLCALAIARAASRAALQHAGTARAQAYPHVPAQLQLPLLPPLGHPAKLVLLLDLDETLIATFQEVPACFIQHKGLQCHELQLPLPHSCCSSTSSWLLNSSSKPEGQQQTSRVVVVPRPGLTNFLQQASVFAELVLFTAAEHWYAAPIVQHVLDPTGQLFQGRLLTRQHTRTMQLSLRPQTRAHKPGAHATLVGPVAAPARQHNGNVHHVKDLAHLGRDLSRTVLVEDNPLSALCQPANCLLLQPFRGDPDDDVLTSVCLPLLRSLAAFPDVRPVLQRRFQLHAWFEARGLRPHPEGGAPRAG